MFSPMLAALNAALQKVCKHAGVLYNCAWGVYFWVHKDIFVLFCKRQFSFIADVLNFSLCQLPAHFCAPCPISLSTSLSPTVRSFPHLTLPASHPDQLFRARKVTQQAESWLSAIPLLQQTKKEVSSSPDAENLNIIFCLVCQIETGGNEPLHQRKQSPGLEVLRTP